MADQFEVLLQQLLSPENDVRSPAETAYDAITPTQKVPLLIQVSCLLVCLFVCFHFCLPLVLFCLSLFDRRQNRPMMPSHQHRKSLSASRSPACLSVCLVVCLFVCMFARLSIND